MCLPPMSSASRRSRSRTATVHVNWQTAAELGVAGYRVLPAERGRSKRTDRTGLDPGAPVRDGGAYSLADKSVRPGESVRYELWCAPPVRPTSARRVGRVSRLRLRRCLVRLRPPRRRPSRRWRRPTPPPGLDRLQPACASMDQTTCPRPRAPEPAAGRTILRGGSGTGERHGRGCRAVADAIAATNLSVTCHGTPVAWCPDGTNLLF